MLSAKYAERLHSASADRTLGHDQQCPRRMSDRLRALDDEGDTSGGRSPTQRDSDRILYASQFRRLTGVTQVVSPTDDYVFHDRLMHSLKVAQIGQRLAGKLKADLPRSAVAAAIDPEAVYVAGLAHDLGHAPFGHAGEEELQLLLAGRIDDSDPVLEDSFEGNAQTFRILTKLAFRKEKTPPEPGLNLTWRSLAAVSKYPWKRGDTQHLPLSHNKWGAYSPDGEMLETMRTRAASQKVWCQQRSIDAQVMDWADDITYAVHDVEDFFRASLVPLARLRHVEAERESFKEFALTSIRAKLEKEGRTAQYWDEAAAELMVRNICLQFPEAQYEGSRADRGQLHEFGSATIDLLTRVAIDQSSREDGLSLSGRNGSGLVIPARLYLRAEILKKITQYYVINRPPLRFDQRGQRKVLRELFFALREKITEVDVDRLTYTQTHPSALILPARLRDYLAIAYAEPAVDGYGSMRSRQARAVCDFLTSLTDRQAVALHKRLSGTTDSLLSPGLTTV